MELKEHITINLTSEEIHNIIKEWVEGEMRKKSCYLTRADTDDGSLYSKVTWVGEKTQIN